MKYPHITVQISGEDGNSMFIIGRVRLAMRRAKVPQLEIDAFTAEAMAGNYDHLLQTCMQWVDVK